MKFNMDVVFYLHDVQYETSPDVLKSGAEPAITFLH